MRLKGIVSGEEYFLKAHSFYNFFFLVDEKIELKVLPCTFELLSNFENPSNNPLQ
jgi:hypothetical protein